jgi:hypothetical protein
MKLGNLKSPRHQILTRTIILVTLSSSCFTSCINSTNCSLSQGKIDEIRTQVRPVVDSVFDTKLSLNVAFSPILATKDFVYTYEGKIYSYDSLIITENELAKIQQSEKFTFSSEKFDVLSDNNVCATLVGTLAVNYKNGTSETGAAVETVLIKKINGRWRIVYVHESIGKM